MGQRADELLAQARKEVPLAGRRGEESLFLAKAQGCRVFDADNVAYLDLVGGSGTNLLGYGNQYLLDAVRRASTMGLASGFHIAAELELVELLSEYVPAFSPWAITPSESEAWELALRWCRRDTGRRQIVVFDGNRRGAVESFHVTASGPLGVSQPIVAGIPGELARLIRVVPWGDAEAFSSVLADVGVDTAAVVLDPIAAQFGVIRPAPEFIGVVAAATREAGARLVLDETVTGFRLARGGAAETLGIEPDVAVYGGVLGGGVARIGAVAWARTLSATPNDELPGPPPPIAILAATATLSVLRNESVHQRLEERGADLEAGVAALADRFSRPLRCARIGSVFACAFSRQAVTDGNSFARVDQDTWVRFARACREAGLLLPARSPVPSFISHAHGDKDIEQAVAAMEAGMKKMQKEDEL
ncbi:MAG TPA: aminotransferase class III-fold pyridoxal phosphate-dependent enzyme [Thermoanaerobaculaceae bacterium]|nr:aminotransferase class III-fold pyridoxal phosphate-dependent enzyme [Thermoanaerobaculaceae bacterium]